MCRHRHGGKTDKDPCAVAPNAITVMGALRVSRLRRNHRADGEEVASVDVALAAGVLDAAGASTITVRAVVDVRPFWSVAT